MSLSEQFERKQRKRQHQPERQRQRQQPTSNPAWDSDRSFVDRNQLKEPLIGNKNSAPQEDDDSVRNKTEDPYHRVRQTFKDASTRSLASLRSIESGELSIDSDRHASYSKMQDDGAFDMKSNDKGDDEYVWDDSNATDKFDTLISDELLEQTVDTCAYCTIIATRVSHTRCYTIFYMLLFALGISSAILSMLTIVADKDPDDRSSFFFAIYGALLVLFSLDVLIRFLASGWTRFRRRHLNLLDITMLVVAFSALGIDLYDTIVGKDTERKSGVFGKPAMFADELIVILLTLLIFTRVLALGCQHVQQIEELSIGMDDVVMGSSYDFGEDTEFTHGQQGQVRADTSTSSLLSSEGSQYNYFSSHQRKRSGSRNSNNSQGEESRTSVKDKLSERQQGPRRSLLGYAQPLRYVKEGSTSMARNEAFDSVKFTSHRQLSGPLSPVPELAADTVVHDNFDSPVQGAARVRNGSATSHDGSHRSRSSTGSLLDVDVAPGSDILTILRTPVG